jgi:transposase InsO family protein
LVPEEQRVQLLEDVHQLGHFGTDKMVTAVMDNGYWWPSLRTDAARLVAACDPCLKFNVVARGYHEEKGSVDAAEPWQLILLDLAEPPKADTGEKYLLVIVDAFTRFVVLRPLKDKSAASIAKELWKLFADFGVPKAIQSDNGTEFVNAIVREMRRAFGIQHRLVAAYNHSANGLVERGIRTVSTMLKKHLKGANQKWPQWVPLMQMAVNMVANVTTATAPCLLMFGRAWQQPGDYSGEIVSAGSEDDRKKFADKLKWFVEKLYPAVVQRSAAMKKKGQAYRQRRERKAGKIEIGSIVYALDPVHKSKWDSMYDGPYEVIGVDDKKCFVLKDGDGKVLGRHIPIDQVKVVAAQNLELVYAVEAVLDHKETANGVHYLVKWKGHQEDENSWEPVEHFNDWTAINKYWKSCRKDAAPGVLDS